MKLLKVIVPNGYYMLEPGFEINFLTKTRIDKNSSDNDLIELEPDFYLPKETAFIGKNSSGKTTVIKLINLAQEFLKNGRIFVFDTPKDNFKISIIFYEDGFIYKYDGEFVRNSANDRYLLIVDENLSKTTHKASYKKDLSNASFSKVKEFEVNKEMDTSNINKYKFNKGFSFYLNLLANYDDCFYDFSSLIEPKTFTSIIRLFDDSIEYIKPVLDDNDRLVQPFLYKFKRKNSDEREVTSRALTSLLSDGTVRGIKFYSAAVISFAFGGTLIIDEIEKNFNKNLIYNIFDMFNDPKINKKNASLIYSTHYAEILDNSNRCDNINVLHRDGDRISIKNMSEDYEFRTELKKSELFDQNAFDNLLNYDALMQLKRYLRK